MKVREVMSGSVDSVDASDSIATAARLMAAHDVGMLPVTEEEKLAGIVTDRDIVVRAVAHAVHSGSPVLRIMTKEVARCSADDDVADALRLMGEEQVRRLPVCAEDGTLIGIISLADAARDDRDRREVAAALAGICHPSGHHCQSAAAA